MPRYFFRLVCLRPTRSRRRSSRSRSSNRIGIERHLPESATRAISKIRCFSRWRRKQCRPASAGAATRPSRRCWYFSYRPTARLGAFCRRPALSTANASFRSYGCRSQCRVRRTITLSWRSASRTILTHKARRRQDRDRGWVASRALRKRPAVCVYLESTRCERVSLATQTL